MVAQGDNSAEFTGLEQHSIRPIRGPQRALIKKARELAQRVESLPEEDMVDLSGYRPDHELGNDPEEIILTGSDPEMPLVRVRSAIRWWIPNLVYSRLSRLVKLSVLEYSVATHVPAEMEADDFVVVCQYFRGWLPLEEWRELPQDERVQITNPGEFGAHVALEFLVDVMADDDQPFGYVLTNGAFLRNPSSQCFGPLYIGMAVKGSEEQWQGSFHYELDEPPPQIRWKDFRNYINEYNALPSAVANLLRNLAALTDDDLVSCVRLPDFPYRERVQSILLSRLLRIRKTANNYLKKIHELADKDEED